MNISIRGMLSEVNKGDLVFSLKYRKADGNIGNKKRLRIDYTGTLNKKRMNRSGLLKVIDLETSRRINITIDLIQEFNGIRVLKS